MPRLYPLALAPLLFACQMSPQTAANAEAELIDVVAFETGCPEDEISILSRDGDAYDVLACGEALTYGRTNDVFHEI